ncbi:MAG: amidohydrolase family protein [Deltaproteobacteria bacterium]|nr:amidohydrolase family protein [Deltaproteobacteria bacterium]
MIVDAHVHPVFAGTPIHPGLDQLSQAYYGRDASQLSLDEFVKELDRAKVDKTVLLTVAWKNQPVRQRNEATAELVKLHADRFVGFGSFDPNAAEGAVTEVEYVIEELGLSGVKIIAQNVEVFYNDPRFYPVYEKIQALGVPVIFHTGPSFLHTRTKFWSANALEDIALDFPRMKMILAHLGMQSYMDIHSLLVRHQNVYADLSFWPLNPRYRHLVPWSLLEETVPRKLLLGSDFPVGQSPAEAIDAVGELPISEGCKRLILGENAAGLLNL